jgi:hypothetical protein
MWILEPCESGSSFIGADGAAIFAFDVSLIFDEERDVFQRLIYLFRRKEKNEISESYS